MSENSLWYAPIKQDGETIIQKINASKGRRMLLSKGIRELTRVLEIDYKSLHKFRHGHVVYAISRVKDMAGLKAVSQNVMHSSVGITDSIYGNLISDDINKVILGINTDLAVKTKEAIDLENLIPLLQTLINNPELLHGLNNLKN
ncbi:MAG: site-specific integrase [Anaerolineaceae bacterium]